MGEIHADVIADPLPDNVSHALIQGSNNQERSRALARRVRVVQGIESRDQAPSND